VAEIIRIDGSVKNMYNIGDYLIYRRNVCKVVDIKKSHLNDKNYYVLVPSNDESLKIDVPIVNKCSYMRNLISREEVEELIDKIPTIGIMETNEINDRFMGNEYKNLINTGTHENLIKIIKTTYLKNKERIDNKKKTRELENTYFKLAEKYLYSELSIVLGMSYEDTKNYVVARVTKLYD
jgi:CarD family transcriptional regulator